MTRPIAYAVVVLVVPIALVAIYTIGWVVYADQHLRPHYARAAPGAAADARGVTWRVLNLTSTGSLASSTGAPPAVPDAGTVWIVADVEALQPDGRPPLQLRGRATRPRRAGLGARLRRPGPAGGEL